MKIPFRHECRHFNGIQHKSCHVGVAYDSVRDGTKSIKTGIYPCLGCDPTEAATRCPKFEATTQADFEAREKEINESLERLRGAHARGECHVCGKPVEPSQIVGRCKYAACGHRVGQVATREP